MALPYRKFKLVNALNDTFELTEQNFKVFGNNPRGLGFSKTLSGLRMGDEELVYYSMVNLDEINLELLFFDDALSDKYQKYFDFINFLSFKPITLYYQRPNSFDWFRRRIESVSLAKTEVNYDDRMLHCEYLMKPLTFWESDEAHIIEVSSGMEEGKIYPITYPIVYGADNTSGIHMVSQGLLESPLMISIEGASNNPEYILYDENNNIYGRGKFIGDYGFVEVNSRESEEEIKLIQNGLLIDNPMAYQDLTVGSPNEIYVTFLKLKVGRSKISFFLGQEFEGKVRLEWRDRYVSV